MADNRTRVQARILAQLAATGEPLRRITEGLRQYAPSFSTPAGSTVGQEFIDDLVEMGCVEASGEDYQITEAGLARIDEWKRGAQAVLDSAEAAAAEGKSADSLDVLKVVINHDFYVEGRAGSAGVARAESVLAAIERAGA